MNNNRKTQRKRQPATIAATSAASEEARDGGADVNKRQKLLPILSATAISVPTVSRNIVNGGRECAACHEMKPSAEFSTRQKKKNGRTAKCRGCIAKQQSSVATAAYLHACCRCHRKKHSLESFRPEELQKGLQARCITCVEEEKTIKQQRRRMASTYMVCRDCYTSKRLLEFPKSEHEKEFDYKDETDPLCMLCSRIKQVFVECVRCREKYAKNYITGSDRRFLKKQGQGLLNTSVGGDGSTLYCLDCVPIAAEEERKRQERIARNKIPRECSQCHQIKEKNSYSSAQWNKESRPSCSVCLTPEKEKELRQKEAWDKQKGENCQTG